MHKGAVADRRGDDAHIHAGLGRGGQRGDHLVIDDEIGGVDIHIVLSAVDEMHVHRFADRLVVERRIAERLHPAGGGDALAERRVRRVAGEILRDAARVVPHGEKHRCERVHALAAQHDARVEPVAAALHHVDIGVREVDPAREADIPVDHTDLAVVAVVEPRRENGDKPVEHAAADALGLKRVFIALRQLVHAAEIVVHHAHIHAAFRLAAQHLVNGVPHRAGGDDVVLHENELLRLFQLRQKRVKIDLADRKIRCFGMREYRRAGGTVQIVGNALRVRVLRQRRFRCRNAAHRLFILLGHG